jgi:hypothetical protein
MNKKCFSIVSELELQKIAATSFVEFPLITPVNYQNVSRPYPPHLITPHSTDSKLSCANYYSGIEEN